MRRLIYRQMREPIRKLEEHVETTVQKPLRLVVAALILREGAGEGGGDGGADLPAEAGPADEPEVGVSRGED